MLTYLQSERQRGLKRGVYVNMGYRNVHFADVAQENVDTSISEPNVLHNESFSHNLMKVIGNDVSRGRRERHCSNGYYSKQEAAQNRSDGTFISKELGHFKKPSTASF
jgi:hypothetical protein